MAIFFQEREVMLFRLTPASEMKGKKKEGKKDIANKIIVLET